MGKCIIFCAGGFDGLPEMPGKDDYVIAADGGYRHTQALGLTPDCILGDFDSLGFIPESATVFPVEKDDTDAMLAVRQGLSLGYQDFIIYGGLEGSRLEHTVANFQTLAYLAEQGARGVLIGNNQIATVVKDGNLSFREGATGYLSVFCLGSDARGVTLTGLHYPLENGTLTAAFPLGVSNRFIGKAARVCVEKGSLLVLFDRENYSLVDQSGKCTMHNAQ